MNKSPVDEALSLDALRAGDRNEFARLVDLFSGRIYRLALQITGNTQDAEDVLQETFLKAFHALPGFEGRSSLSTWLYRIAVNEALMILRRQKVQFSLAEDNESNDEEKTEALQLVDWCCLPEDELQSTETRRVLDEAIQRLSPALRVVFLLRDVEGLSVKDTADSLGITESAVKVRLLRARLRLREELSTYFSERMEK
ncbi:MAG: sigma-70 family RNA polymerase sigma factor [Anaerolineales bacterium]